MLLLLFHTPKLQYNEQSCQVTFVHYILSLLIVKGAGISSLYHKIHYIEIHYIKVWMYFKMNYYW